MRRSIPVAVAAVAVVLLASAAHAKEPGQAEMSGPGLAAPIRFHFGADDGDPGEGPFFTLMDQSGFWAMYKPAKRPAGDLGPRYQVDVLWGAQPSDPVAVNRFFIYPYAPRQPVTYTPEQVSDPNTPGATPGWYVARPSFFDFLVAQGLPRTAPALPDAEGPRAVPSPEAPPWGWIVAFGALGGLLLGGAAAGLARRRARVVA